MKSDILLFINGIRTDLSSGGLTSTKLILKDLRKENELFIFSLQPYFDNSKWNWIQYLLSSPSPIFVLINRILKIRVCEFFLRFSLFYCFWLIYIQLIHRPKIIIFNHHSSFVYSIFFWRVKKIFIWHDLPNLKNVINGKKGCDRLLMFRIERLFLKSSNLNYIFSFSEMSFIRRFYKCECRILPVVQNNYIRRSVNISKNRLLLIGNWNRPENYEGAFNFFVNYAKECQKNDQISIFEFHVAGSGAHYFVNNLLGSLVIKLKFRISESYINISEFDELALLAPVETGAGIKLKTLEAWSVAMPVFGLKQAFSGLPHNVWTLGGARFETIESLVEICCDKIALISRLNTLRPIEAFSSYKSKFNELSKSEGVLLDVNSIKR